MFAPTGSGSLVSDPEERRLKRPIEVWVAALLIVAVMGALAFYAFDQSAALLVDLGSLS